MRNKKRLKRNIALIAICSLFSGTLTGCSIFRSTTIDETSFKSTNNSSKLVSGQYYVWHDESQSNIENDINVDMSKFKNYKYDIFTPVYMEGTLDKNGTVGDNYRTIMISAENDSKIPTLYKGDELIYVSTDTLPKKFEFERFYDHGYSIGVSGLTEYIKGSGNYVLNTSGSELIKVKSNSSVSKLANYISNTDECIVSFPYIGEKAITPSDISKSGTIKGLLLNSEYNTSIYIGSIRHVMKFKADTRIFSSYETIFSSNQYSFIGSNVIKITIPEYFKSGYYNINGCGLFRYVADGTSYDNTTNFNDPIIEKDDAGHIIYNPVPDIIEKSETDNIDIINQSGAITSIKKSVSVSNNESIKIDVFFQDVIDKTKKNSVQIKYYTKNTDMPASSSTEKASTEKTSNSTNSSNVIGTTAANTGISGLGTEDNPYLIIATNAELYEGVLSREISNLKEGTWIFEIYGTSNYRKHTENIVTLKTQAPASGDFTN